MKNSKKELEIIDPFAEEYRKLVNVRSDAHYRELYEDLFRSIPPRARAALVKNYLQYINNCLQPFFSFLNPFSWINPQAIVTNMTALLASMDGLVAKPDQRVLGPGGIADETQKAIAQACAILGDVRQRLKAVDAILADAQAVSANAKTASANVAAATADLAALRAEVDTSLRKVGALIDE